MHELFIGLKNIAQKYHIDKIVLFGSRARGDNSPKSDVDIAVFFANGYLEKEKAPFVLEVADDLPTLYEIDVVCVDGGINKQLLDSIISDGVNIYMRETQYNRFSKAVLKLKEAKEIYERSGDELHRDGFIQRFEFTFELAWKALMEYLESEGYIDAKTPKSVLKKAFSLDLIDGEMWNDMLADRNLTSHIYQEEIAVSICGRLQSSYVGLLENLAAKLKIMNDLK